MISFLLKKKISEDKATNIFVNAILKMVDEGFPEVAALINEDPEFETKPQVNGNDYDEFLLIVLAGNLCSISKYFDGYQEVRVSEHVLKKFGKVLNIDFPHFKELINSYKTYFSRINHPSKNTLYAMSKAVFHKYNLNQYQEEYFRNMKTPNPIFLKRLDDIMANFLFDWMPLKETYKITE
jgi:hypothetical protein